MSMSGEAQSFWLLQRSPHAEMCAISTKQRALGLVLGGEVFFFSPCCSPCHMVSGHVGERTATPLSLHVCA